MIVSPPKAKTTSSPASSARDLHRVGPVAEPGGERRQAMQQLARNERCRRTGSTANTSSTGVNTDPGRERVGEAVVGVRPEILLEQHLEAVGEAVEQAPPDELDLRERDAHVGAVRADAVGHDRRLLALDPGQHRAEHQQHRHRVADENEIDDEVLHHAGAPSVAASAANSASASATDAFFAKHGSNALTTPSKFV